MRLDRSIGEMKIGDSASWCDASQVVVESIRSRCWCGCCCLGWVWEWKSHSNPFAYRIQSRGWWGRASKGLIQDTLFTSIDEVATIFVYLSMQIRRSSKCINDRIECWIDGKDKHYEPCIDGCCWKAKDVTSCLRTCIKVLTGIFSKLLHRVESELLNEVKIELFWYLRDMLMGVNAMILIATIGNQQRQSVRTMAKNRNARIASSFFFASIGSAGLVYLRSDLIQRNIL